jgi:hypothetical protein
MDLIRHGVIWAARRLDHGFGSQLGAPKQIQQCLTTLLPRSISGARLGQSFNTLPSLVSHC